MNDNSIVIRTTAVFGFILTLMLWLSSPVFAQHEMSESQEKHEIQHDEAMVEEYFNAGEMIIEHITDAYEWHIMTIGETHVSVPLPVILYDQGKFMVFSSSHLHHGKYLGYTISEEGAMKGKIVRKDAAGAEIRPDLDISFTKNVLA
ncbi:MAG TPA: hypothetical protein VIN10_15235, partial [Bacteroidales bacterium]